jgi:hypothetical protein
MTENENSPLESLLERADDYGKTTLELLKLKAVDKSSDAVSSIISRAIPVFLLLMFLLIGSFALSYWLGDLLGNVWHGFLIVAGFYGLLGILFLLLHNWLKNKVANGIIKQLLK